VVGDRERNPGEPAVLVNKCHDPIVDVLQTETFFSPDAYLKEVIKAEMGTATWMQLVVHTAATIAESGEPEFDWQEGVIEEITPYLYDDDARPNEVTVFPAAAEEDLVTEWLTVCVDDAIPLEQVR
jgi:hypothetical protein